MAIVNIPDGTENWGDEARANWTDLDTRVTTAQSTADSALSAATSAVWRPSLSVFKKAQRTAIWAGAAGHNFSSAGSSGTFNLNDTSDYIVGSQAISAVTTGAGDQTVIAQFAGPVMDMTGKIPAVFLKIDNYSKVLDLNIWIGSSGLANGYTWSIEENAAAWPWLAEGQWVMITLPRGKATVNGTPVPASMTDFEIQLYDNSTGQVTIHFGGLYFVPEQTEYPNGVVTFSFDDGILSQYTTARPYLDKYGYAATAYIIAETLYNHGSFPTYFDLTQAHKLEDYSGWDIASHAYTAATHNAGYDTLSSAAQLADMRNCKAYLGGEGFRGVDHFAYPLGRYDETVRLNVRKTFVSGRLLNNPTYESLPVADLTKVRSWAPTNLTPLSGAGSLQQAVDRAKTGKEWLIFCLHDIVASPSTSIQMSTANFQGLVDYCNSQGVAVRTVSEVLAGV